MKKWVSHLIDGVMGFFIVGLFSLQITMMISEKNNYGVPSLFGYSFMQVLTDSMAKPNSQTVDTTYEDLTDSDGNAITVTKLGPLSLDQYTGIIIEKADASSIQVGEVITFYSDILKAPVTHRVIEIKKDTDNSYVFYTFGDNPESLTCETWVTNKVACTYPANRDTVAEKYLIGRVIWHSDAFGALMGVVQSSWFVPLAVLLPITVIATMSAIDLVKQAKAEAKAENDAVAAEFAASGTDPKDEKAVVAFEEKARYKYELTEEIKAEADKEKEKIAKEMAKEKAREMKKIKKEMKKETPENDKINTNHDKT
jgi:hypothetical protein